MPIQNAPLDTNTPSPYKQSSARLKRYYRSAVVLGVLLILAVGVRIGIGLRAEKDRLLISAVKQGDVEEVKSLLAHGASPNARQVRTWELSGIEKDTIQREGLKDYPTPSALHIACGYWATKDVDYERIRHLYLGLHIPTQYPNVVPFTPNPEIIKLLVDAGADVNETDYDSSASVLSAAARWMDVDTVEYLLKKGAKVNDFRGGSSALMMALMSMDRDRSEIVEALLKHGADPNKEVPLSMILVPNRLKNVHLLVKYGADINAKNQKGETVLHQMKQAVKKKQIFPPSQDVIDLLQKMGAKDEPIGAKEDKPKTPSHEEEEDRGGLFG